jgi:NADH:ubiquinone oxidoreductase subunit K
MIFISQLDFNFVLFFLSLFGLVASRSDVIKILMCIELLLLSLNLNFSILSVYFDDFYGQIFSLFILTVAAAESAIGLAVIILFYRLRSSISITQASVLRH